MSIVEQIKHLGLTEEYVAELLCDGARYQWMNAWTRHGLRPVRWAVVKKFKNGNLQVAITSDNYVTDEWSEAADEIGHPGLELVFHGAGTPRKYSLTPEQLEALPSLLHLVSRKYARTDRFYGRIFETFEAGDAQATA